MNSFISWIGGKKLLRKHILELFPEEYSRYIEVFGGAGWVLFGDERKGVLEVYNDINSDLVNLYRCIKYHPGEMQKELQGVFTSRELFFDARSQMQILHIIMLKSIIQTDSMEKTISDYMTVLIK